MAKNNNLTDFLTSEANKFRSVLGTSGTINPQDFDDLIDDVYTKGYNDHVFKYDYGTFEVDADSASYTITDIADSNGNSFTPNAILFIMYDSSPTTHDLGASRMFVFYKRTGLSARICTFNNAANTIRTNGSTGGITYNDGSVRYATTSSAYYIAKGTYRWYAWEEE